MEINREGWERVCGGQQVAGENLYRIVRGEIQGYGVSIDPLALVLFATGACPLSLVLERISQPSCEPLYMTNTSECKQGTFLYEYPLQ
jgi:hypothetical protein